MVKRLNRWTRARVGRQQRSCWRRFALVIACSFIGGTSRGDDFSAVFLPHPSPEPSSMEVTIAAPLIGTASDRSALAGTATLHISPTVERSHDAQLSDLELVLVDGMDFSLLGGAVTVRAEPGAARVRMLESGAAGPIVDGRFDQLENLFQFEGQIFLSTETEPYDLSSVAPMQADLLGIELDTSGRRIAASLTVDLEFVASIAAPPLGQIPLSISLDANLQAIAPPNGTADVDGSGRVDHQDIDALHAAIRNRDNDSRFDLSGNGTLDADDAALWVHDLMSTSFGDADLNGRFDSSDLVAVLQQGKYEDVLPMNSGWAEGDWNGDGETSSADLVLALQEGCYEAPCRSPAALVAVPEPAAGCGAALGLLSVGIHRRRRAKRRGTTPFDARPIRADNPARFSDFNAFFPVVKIFRFCAKKFLRPCYASHTLRAIQLTSTHHRDANEFESGLSSSNRRCVDTAPRDEPLLPRLGDSSPCYRSQFTTRSV